jgi:hypothetical protein
MKTFKIIDNLKNISENHSYKSIKFADGSIRVDAWTANAMLCVFNAINDDNKLKFAEKIHTKAGFIQVANFSFQKTKVK